MIRITTGFAGDQKFSIENSEAHKAYYLFRNPEKRGVFNNGLALIGKFIQDIQVDYHGTMGWNPSHRLDDADWNDIRARGVDKEMQEIMLIAKEVANKIDENPQFMNMKLSEAAREIGIIENDKQKIIGGGFDTSNITNTFKV